MPCEQCAGLFQLRFTLGPLKSYIYSRQPRLLEANKAQCWMCKLLYDWLPGHNEYQEDEDESFWSRLTHYIAYDIKKDLIKYQVSVWQDDEGILHLSLSYWPSPVKQTLHRKDSAWDGISLLLFPEPIVRIFRRSTEMPASTGSEQALNQALEWLDKCRNEHVLCNSYRETLRTNESDFRPTRLIEILPDKLWLHETVNKPYHYVALSHRWPSIPGHLLTLTLSNYKKHLNAIPESRADRFSKVFSDAISVCRHLGINYIWIDSLCIIQAGDENEDWQKESLRMGSLYKHAVFTISAASIIDENIAVSEGMFRNRNPIDLEPFMVYCAFDTAVSSIHTSLGRDVKELFASQNPKPGNYLVLAREPWLSSLASAPIFARGWVAQERLLSPRIIYFAGDQIWFHCVQLLGCEVFPTGKPMSMFAHPTSLRRFTYENLVLRDAGLTLIPEDISARGVLDLWMQLTATFAPLQFSKGFDKLVSLKGLAKSIMPFLNIDIEHYKEHYKAGIWVKSFPYNLLWYTNPVNRPAMEVLPADSPYVRDGATSINRELDSSQRAPQMVTQPLFIRPPNKYQGPSWSWASVNWQIELIRHWKWRENEILVFLDSFDISTLPADDPFGRVLPDSSLDLHGRTYSATLTWYDVVQSEQSQHLEVKSWAQLSTKFGTLKTRKDIFINDDAFVWPDERFIEGVTPKTREDLRILPVLRATRREAKNGVRFIDMLILEPVQRLGENVYKRFGIAGISSGAATLFLPKILRGLWKDVEGEKNERIRIV